MEGEMKQTLQMPAEKVRKEETMCPRQDGLSEYIFYIHIEVDLKYITLHANVENPIQFGMSPVAKQGQVTQ